MTTATAAKPKGLETELKAKDFAIPPCPAILTKLLRETRSDDPDPRKVSQLIGSDVALAAAVINVANSAYYGLRNKATSVQQVVTMIVIAAVSQRVTGLLLQQAFPGQVGPAMEQYWKSSMATALIAQAVARETRIANAELCHTYALFQNCGMPVMLNKFPIYADIFDGSALTDDPIQEVEEIRYATSHAKIGAQFAHAWELSESLCLAIRHHHDLPAMAALRSKAPRETLALVAVGLAAEQIYCLVAKQSCADWLVGEAWVLEELGMSVQDFAALPGAIKGALNAV